MTSTFHAVLKAVIKEATLRKGYFQVSCGRSRMTNERETVDLVGKLTSKWVNGASLHDDGKHKPSDFTRKSSSVPQRRMPTDYGRNTLTALVSRRARRKQFETPANRQVRKDIPRRLSHHHVTLLYNLIGYP